MSILSKLGSIWSVIYGWISNPMTLAEKARKSPVFFALMIFFMIQPLVSFYITTMQDIGWIERRIDPSKLAESNRQKLESLQNKISALEAVQDQHIPPKNE